ncbi:hypothetical protein ALC60_01122 [Trachymyrmex zeteki]|uniref:Uncharacterized protein n=1 Tax=Mycetomoellerius zeteki TaxID=64791 RepID=A0A151XHA3_9HYME|nr:hypothetical protein ALC60_01122 [Trachymyrmex zeteki]
MLGIRVGRLRSCVEGVPAAMVLVVVDTRFVGAAPVSKSNPRKATCLSVSWRETCATIKTRVKMFFYTPLAFITRKSNRTRGPVGQPPLLSVASAPSSRRIRRTPRVEITAKLVLAEKINWKLCTLRHPI